VTKAKSLAPRVSAEPGFVQKRHWGGWSMAAVPALIAAWVVFYPLFYNIWTSLHVNKLSVDDGLWVGLKNYIQLAQFGDLLGTLGRTLVWTVGCLVFQALIGFVIALALDRPGRGIGFVRTLCLSPWVMPGIVIAGVWSTIYNPIGGLANGLLGALGLPGHDWLGDPKTALPALILVNVWKGFSFWMLMIGAGLKGISSDLYEAAAIDGATYLKRVRYIVIPGLSNILVLTTVLAFIWTFNYADLSYAMTHGGPGTSTPIIAFNIYKLSFVYNRFDQGAALSVISFLLMAVAIGFYASASRRRH